MSKVLVIVRQLNIDSPPVASAVFMPPLSEVDDLEHYYISKSKEHIEEMKNAFIEFKDAKFYTYMLDSE